MKIINARYIIATLLYVFTALSIKGQTPGWQWVQSGGGNGFPSQPGADEVTDYAFDREGNLIVGGSCTWFPEFDTIHFTSSVNWQNKNLFLAKYDKCGNVLWARVGGGDGLDVITGLDVDEQGNIYTQGYLSSSGNPVFINTPKKDTTFNVACSRHFMKFDKDGNLLYLKGSTEGQQYLNGYFKRLKNGTFLTLYLGAGAPVTVGNYTIPRYARSLVILDTLGNVIKGAMIDTTIRTGNSMSDLVLDEKENIYFSFANINSNPIAILDSFLNPAPVLSYYLVKTDTSFKIKKINATGYMNDACYNLDYSNGYLYTSGRNENGAYFEFDTSRSNLITGTFTVYKIDTNLHLVWASQADTQTANPAFTTIRPCASKDYIYLAYQHRGTIRWDSARLVVPGNTYEMAVLKMRTSDGVCVEGTFTGGISSSSDQFQQIDVDEHGNPYFIGTFTNGIGTFTDSVWANGGSSSADYFILKWGLPCTDTLNSLDKPEAPTNLVATATGPQTISVVWQNNAPLRLGFTLYRSPDGVSNWTQVSTLAHNQYSYSDNNLQPGTVYWYKVATYTTGGESGFSNIDSAQTWPSQCSALVGFTNNDSLYSFSPTPTGFGTLTYQWSLNGTNFSTDSISTQVIPTSGSYNVCVTVTDASQCTASNCATITVTGIHKEESFHALLFPNPVKDDIQISINALNRFSGELIISDLLGNALVKEFLQINPGISQMHFNCIDWAIGAYQIQIKSNQGMWSEKIIKY